MKYLRTLFIMTKLATGLTNSFIDAAQKPFGDLENHEQASRLQFKQDSILDDCAICIEA